MTVIGVRRLPLAAAGEPPGCTFDQVLREERVGGLVRERPVTLQVNVGKHCNMACRHCHVDAGPSRTERMTRRVAERVVTLLAATPGIETLDVTGGAPELNPSFRYLVREARRLGRRVIDRCNLSILLEPGMEDLGELLAGHEVHVIASLPCYSERNVDRQRGGGAFDRSIAALRKLNAIGYGMPDSELRLDLVYNPGGAFLPPPQESLEHDYRVELRRAFGIEFHHLLTLTNMPISRFRWSLEKNGELDRYMRLLRESFNRETADGVMCRSLISVGWDGRLYDCDFNQMLELPLGTSGVARSIWDVDSFDELAGQPVATGDHCFGCTAGSGSSCSGALK